MAEATRPPKGRGPPPPPSTAVGGAVGGGTFTNPAAAWVNSLAKAARAFILYDPGNAVVRQFLADYAEKARRVLAQGPLALEVGPFEISSGGEVVYRERDRERSLAFRLFRDGVRRVSIDPGVHWEELLLLLQILAVRFTGIQQQEEDIVTLLWKAEFRGIAFQVVQGFASEDEEPQTAAGPGGRAGAGEQRGGSGGGGSGSGGSGSEARGDPMSGSPEVGGDLARAAVAASAVAALAGDGLRSEPPPRWDEPLPRLPQPAAVAYRPVAAQSLQDLLADEAPEALPGAVLAAVRDLLAEAARSAWSMPDSDLDEFVREARAFLLGDGPPSPGHPPRARGRAAGPIGLPGALAGDLRNAARESAEPGLAGADRARGARRSGQGSGGAAGVPGIV